MNYKTYEIRVYPSGEKNWYLNGKKLTEKKWEQKIKQNDCCDGKIIEIEGKKYKLISV